MQRRNALKSMATGVGALFALPLWATNWNATNLPTSHWLPTNQKILLEAACEALLPATSNYPGASDLKVHLFVEKMIEDCYDLKTQKQFQDHLTWLAKQSQHLFGSTFDKATPKQRLNVLQSLEVSSVIDQSNFYKLLKTLALQGYTTSEYYQTKVMKYELVPGRFVGCKSIQ